MDDYNKSLETLYAENKNKNKLIPILIIVAIIISFAFYFFPFQNLREKTSKVKKVYFAENITKAHLEIIKRFNERHKGKIKVVPVNFNYEVFNTNKRKELIARAMRSHSSRIDLFSVDQIWIPRFAKWAEPLTTYFSKNELKNIIKPAYSTCVYKNVLYSIPLFVDIGVTFYRKDIIDKLHNADKIEDSLKKGISWHELILLKKNHPNIRYLFQGKAYEGLICNFLELINDNGAILDRKNFDQLNSRKVVKRLNFFVDLIYKYHLIPREAINFDEVTSFKYALANNIPFLRGWPTMSKLVNIPKKERYKLNYIDIAAPPHFGGYKSTSTLGGWNLMVSRYSKVKKEAVAFIKFTMSPEAQEILYSYGGYLPVIKSFYHDPKLLSKYPRLIYFNKLLKRRIQRPAMEKYTRISDILAFYLNKALKKEISADSALTKAKREIINVIYAKDEYSRIRPSILN